MGSWLVAAVAVKNPRDRRLVTLAGILPDADGLGIVADIFQALASGRETSFQNYARFHHLWCHGWPAALVFAVVLAGFARQRWRVALWCLVTFHLHLLCDLLGSRGPAPADLWPICYGEPLFHHPIWFWKHQWRLDGWQNMVIFLVVFALAIGVALRRGFSFVEVFSRRADAVFVRVLRQWRTRLSGGNESRGA